MDTIKIVVRELGLRDYSATTDGYGEYPGTSPDEALGHAVRELWLSDTLDGPVYLDIRILDAEAVKAEQAAKASEAKLIQTLNNFLG